MNKLSKLLCLLLVLAMVVSSMTACKKSTEESSAAESSSEEEESSTEESTEDSEEEDEETSSDTPLVIGTSAFSEQFSPFFAESAYDQDVTECVSLSMMTYDRVGNIIMNAIEGETVAYNGTDYTYTGPCDLAYEYDEASDTTTYTIKMREDLVFSDGEPVTADDIIFSYYVMADPSYDGNASIYSDNIVGMENYRTQTSDEVYEKYGALADEYYAAGPDNADYADDELYASYWETMKEQWTAICQAIVDYCLSEYMVDEYVAGVFGDGVTCDDVKNDPAKAIYYGMAMWGFDTDVEEPTIEDFYNATYEAYAGDAAAFSETEAPNGEDAVALTKEAFISTYGSQDDSMEGGVPNISGIQKVNDYTVTVTTNGYTTTAIYDICGISIAPLHYYGDTSMYDYDNNQFGFTFGDISAIKEKTSEPLGAGPYTFVKYENKTVYLEANPLYYKGEPKTKNVQFKESAEADMISGIATGTIDIANKDGSMESLDEICSYNSNGETTGDVITTQTVDFMGYGYICINAQTIKVGEDAGSEESKDLRKAICTVLAVYRDLAIDSYYGELAEVLNYPISNVSWAAPQKSDEGYEVAYSKDVDGNDIYTSDMTDEERYAAALDAALGYFEAAGYTVENGKLTAAPEGAKLDYQIIIPGDGSGDHPSYGVLTNAKEALESIGFTLTIYDPTDSNELWETLDAGTNEMHCAAWGAALDPDVYSQYYSVNVYGNGGTNQNYYGITDSTLDELLMESRTSDDHDYRKAVFKQIFDTVLDWAVELPIYQRKDTNIFSTERINMDTVAQDQTPFYSYLKEIETIEMN